MFVFIFIYQLIELLDWRKIENLLSWTVCSLSSGQEVKGNLINDNNKRTFVYTSLIWVIGLKPGLKANDILTQVTAKTLAQHDELMKKTETMSILMETNKMLREEKDKSEQELQLTQAKVSFKKNNKKWDFSDIIWYLLL